MSDHIEHECTECGSLLCPSTHCLKPTQRVIHVMPRELQVPASRILSD